MTHKILFLNNQDMNHAITGNMELVIENVKRCLELLETGDAINPGKLVTRMGNSPEDENVNGRINAMPGYIGGEFNVYGIKWIGSGPQNYKKGLPRASVVVILNDPDTKLPIVIADGTEVSSKRTGSIGGLAIKYLAKTSPETMLICGAGAQGRTQLEAALIVCPSLKQFYVYDLYPEKADAFSKEMSNKFQVEVIPVNNLKKAASVSDIIVTVTLANEPFIEFEWLKKGALLMNMADDEVSRDCVSKADRIICDTWDGIKDRMISTIALMYRDGLISDDDIDAELGEIITGKKTGRNNDDEIIYFNSVGLGILDLSVVAYAYNICKERDIGTLIDYWK